MRKKIVPVLVLLAILLLGCQNAPGAGDSETGEVPLLKPLPQADDGNRVQAADGIPMAEGIPGTACKSVIPGHNKVDRDRINVVFVGFNAERDDFREFLPQLVDFDGTGYTTTFSFPAKAQSESGEILNIPPEEEKTFYGLLGTEPFKSNNDKFNFWYIDEIQSLSALKNPEKMLVCALRCKSEVEDSCGLSNIFTVNVCNANCNPKGNYLAQEAFIGPPGAQQIRIMVHEFGHLLGLQDEYTVANGADAPGYPNCAPSRELAQQWWGDLAGQGHGVLAIGYYQGCSLTEDNIRPTESSLMRASANPDIGLGPVNERHIREVLEEFSGEFASTIEERDMGQIFAELQARRER